MDAHLKPISTNPVDLVLAQLAQMDKFIAMLEFKRDLEARGWVQKIRTGERIPEGYAIVNDPAFRSQHAFAFTDEEGNQQAGVMHWNHVVPERIAGDINNYLSPSLYRFKAYQSFRKYENLVMMGRLGWSAFHAGFTTADTAFSHLAVALQAALDGRPAHQKERAAAAALESGDTQLYFFSPPPPPDYRYRMQPAPKPPSVSPPQQAMSPRSRRPPNPIRARMPAASRQFPKPRATGMAIGWVSPLAAAPMLPGLDL